MEEKQRFEKLYEIVKDQRGCGNTYYGNKEAEKTTLDLLLSDLNELVDYVRMHIPYYLSNF